MKTRIKLIALVLCVCLLVTNAPMAFLAEAVTLSPVNGNFEDATVGQMPTGWTVVTTNSGGVPDSSSNWTGNYTVTAVSDNGSKALKLTPKNASGTRGYVAAVSEAFAVDGATPYTVTYDRKIENPNDVSGTNSGNYGAKVMVYYYDASMKYLGADWKDGKKAQQDWTEHSIEVTTLKNAAYVKIGFYIGGSWNGAAGFSYYYDNVTAKPTAQQGGGDEGDQGGTPDVMFNGDAEQTKDGTLPNWTVTQMNSNSTVATNSNWPFTATAGVGQGVDGSNSLRFTKNKGYGYAALTSIAVEVEENTYYRLDYMLKFSNVSGAGKLLGLRAVVEELDANGTQVGWYKVDDTGSGIGADNDLSDGYTSAYTDWQAVATGFKTGKNTASVRLYFWLGGIGGSNQATADLDNIVLTALSDKELLNGDLDMVNLGHVKDGRKGEKPGQVFWSPETTYAWGYTSREDGVSFTGNYAMEPVNDAEGHETAAKLYVTRSAGGLGAATYYSEPVQVRPGMEYTAAYDLKITGVDNAAVTGGAAFLVRFLDADGNIILLGKDANGNEIQAKELNGHPKQNQAWKEYSHSFTVPEDAHYVQLGMTIGVGTKDTNPNMAYWYDNITLTSTVAAEDLWSELYGKQILWAGDALASQMAELSGTVSVMAVTDAAVDGAGFADALEDRIVTQLNDNAAGAFDYVLISGTLADTKAAVSVGTVSAQGVLQDFDTAAYAGALEEVLLSIATSYDGTKAAFIFPYAVEGTDLSAYRAAAKAACEKWKLPFIDLYGDTSLKAYVKDGKLTAQGQQLLWQKLKKELEGLEKYDALRVSGFSVELALTNRLSSIVGSGVTPATNMDALEELAQTAQKHGLSQIVEQANAYIAQFDAFRPQMVGATIGDFEPNGLRFIAKNGTAGNVTVTRGGILVIEKSKLDGELSLYTEGAVAYETENPASGAVITGTALGEEADPIVEYTAVAYTVYLVEGTEYAFYSINDYVNHNGDTTVEAGMASASVYGIAKDMANALLESGSDAIDYSAIGGKENARLMADATEESEISCLDVFTFVCDNRAILAQIVEKGA